MKVPSIALALGVASLMLAACATTQPQPETTPTSPPAASVETSPPAPPLPVAPTADEAKAFVDAAEASMLDLAIEANRAGWVQANFITDDTQAIAAKANEIATTKGVDLAKEASRFDGVQTDPVTRRKLDLLKLLLVAPAPSDPAKTKELTTIAAAMEANYGSAKACVTANECLDIEKVDETMAESRDPKRLLAVWTAWHNSARPIRDDYQRFVQLSNEGAKELGYADTGAMWRSKYDMPADDFAQELDRLWNQVKPLYNSLHCYVRWKLADRYGSNIVPAGQPIPAHLLGNTWAQEWENIYDIVAPKNSDAGYDVTQLLKKKKYTPLQMVKDGERFFTSLGFQKFPDTFWSRSLITKPRDREVVCHASAWDINEFDDVRLKMCTDVTGEDYNTVHHELGHLFYDLAYSKQPYLFRGSANDGFHEAIGDTIALSVTPPYLVRKGLLDKEPPTSKDIGLLLEKALEKVAFLPFGLVVDQWRWKVFSGQIAPGDYNKAWWQLREKYQGIRPAVDRPESEFDAGAKYHVPGNTPYTRYFLADILQFQFHRSLCEIAGYKGPLNRCTIYENTAAGDRLHQMLALGQSKPWPDALEALTGQRQMDATAILDYFAPLKVWLDQQNTGKTCGW
jgi:peptidyl-dipeptidase A